MSITPIQLGKSGPALCPLGLGCMSMSDFYDLPENRDESESIATICEALDRGVQLVDTADVYGNGQNERLVGRALRQWCAGGGKRDSVVLATKFGNVRDEAGNWLGRNGKPDYVQWACERSLRELGGEAIDLYYLHRVDADTPIEETVGAMGRLVEQGKVRWLGLSEASVETLRRAHRVHPISALQTEYSLWYREPEGEHFAACSELGVAFVPYSPLGRGFLTGVFSRPEDFPDGDTRPRAPRFQGENFSHNLGLAQGLRSLAERQGCTPAQLALSWVLAHNSASLSVLPIPGTKRRKHLADNLGALDLKLSPEVIAELDDLAPLGWAKGTRYPEAGMAAVNL